MVTNIIDVIEKTEYRRNLEKEAEKEAYKEFILPLITKIVNDNSGGIKFTELIVNLIEAISKTDSGYEDDDIDIDSIELIIRESSDLKILDYTWHELNRSKMFVYTH